MSAKDLRSLETKRLFDNFGKEYIRLKLHRKITFVDFARTTVIDDPLPDGINCLTEHSVHKILETVDSCYRWMKENTSYMEVSKIEETTNTAGNHYVIITSLCFEPEEVTYFLMSDSE